MKYRKNPRIAWVFSGAADRGRTDTVSLPLDFESSASANSTTAAKTLELYNNFAEKASVFRYLLAKKTKA